ncbi:MAG: phosphoenolpyruvate mutase [Candidatus Binatia bacterium]|nr:MAG: phosphoenolpyruvate mutase [Candidatus Binatia bacterium]
MLPFLQARVGAVIPEAARVRRGRRLSGATHARQREGLPVSENPSKARLLRERLARPGLVLAVGAHDALSAKLVEEAGFDAVWASGFGISAVSGVPDANILTMTENLDAVKRIAEATALPVVADCDTGYGNAINVLRTVHEYERTGVAGICLEDNVFPKRCSFYGGVRRELVPVEEHAQKIQAAKEHQRDPDFFVVARTEALIAGWGVEEALRRAHAYADAGADAILVHSKASTLDELREFARRWGRETPLVAVPTTYPHVRPEELLQAGFRMAIFANQALRASIPAMREVLRAMREAGSAGIVEGRIAPLEEVYRLVGVPELEESERRYLPTARRTRAVVIAAGFDESLMPLVADRPKSLLDVRGRTILERQVLTLRAAGVDDVSVVRGYRKESFDLPSVRYFDNDRYAETGEVASLFSAREVLDDRFVVLYADILFDRSILDRLLRADTDFAVVVDRSWYDLVRSGEPLPERADLVVTSSAPVPQRRFVPEEEGSTLVRIGQKIPPEQAHAEFVGMALFSQRGARILAELHDELTRTHRGPFHEALSYERASLPDLLQELVDRGHTVRCVEIYKGWMEISSFEDYRRAWAEIRD